MRTSRALTLTAAAAAAALTLSAVPAQAASLSPATVADACSVMLTPTQAKPVGIGKQRVSNFVFANSTKGSPDAPWLCELSGDTATEGKGAQDLISSQVLSLSGKNVTTISQEIHWFSNAKMAKKAYDGLVRKIGRCEGQHSPAPDSDDDTSYTITTKITNGERKAKDGDALLWVNSETILGDPTTNFADHDYVTLRLFGKYIQIIDVDSDGNNAPALTKKQFAADDLLADSLGDARQVKFN